MVEQLHIAAELIDVRTLSQPRVVTLGIEAPRPFAETLGFVGDSPIMSELRAQIRRAAKSNRPVLVHGQTGAGKEVVVQALQQLSARPKEQPVDINCGALPEQLVESQLFGHERGAFTDAHGRHDGFLSVVRDGLLFLDEVGELPALTQAKLLRVLETRKFCRVGSCTPCDFRGRIVAATHVDLAESVKAGRFRRDLFFRLAVLQINVPSLDEHRADIPALIAHFCHAESRTLQFTGAAMQLLMQRSWPGNVRELRNVVDRLLCRSATTPIDRGEIVEAVGDAAPMGGLNDHVRAIIGLPHKALLKTVVRTLVHEALAQTDGNKCAAAAILGVHRKVVERIARTPAAHAAADDDTRE